MDIDLLVDVVDTHPEFMDMTVENLRYVLKFFEVPVPGEIEDADKKQWVRLYRNGNCEFLTPD